MPRAAPAVGGGSGTEGDGPHVCSGLQQAEQLPGGPVPGSSLLPQDGRPDENRAARREGDLFQNGGGAGNRGERQETPALRGGSDTAA